MFGTEFHFALKARPTRKFRKCQVGENAGAGKRFRNRLGTLLIGLPQPVNVVLVAL